MKKTDPAPLTPSEELRYGDFCSFDLQPEIRADAAKAEAARNAAGSKPGPKLRTVRIHGAEIIDEPRPPLTPESVPALNELRKVAAELREQAETEDETPR